MRRGALVLEGLLLALVIYASEIIRGWGVYAAIADSLLGTVGQSGLDFVFWFCCCLSTMCAMMLLLLVRQDHTTKPFERRHNFVDAKPVSPPAGRGAEFQVTQRPERLASNQYRGCLMCSFFDNWPVPKDAAGSGGSIPESPQVVEVDSEAQKEAFEAMRKRFSNLPAVGGLAAQVTSVHASDSISCFGGERSCFHRFLHVNKLDVEAAASKLQKTLAWRDTVNANNIQHDPEALRIFDLMSPHWPERIVGSTKYGSPVSYFDIARAVRTCQMDLWTEKNVESFYVSWMERSLQLQREGRDRCGPLGAGNNMPGAVVVYNLAGLSLTQILNSVSGLSAFVKILGVLDEHYPENLHKAVIVNVPFIFYRFIWPLVQKCLGQDTLNNIHLSEGDGSNLIPDVLGISQLEFDTFFREHLRDRLE